MVICFMKPNPFKVVYVMGKDTYIFRAMTTNDLFDAVVGVADNPNYDFGREEAMSVSKGIVGYIATGGFLDGMFDADFSEENFGEDSAEDSRGAD